VSTTTLPPWGALSTTITVFTGFHPIPHDWNVTQSTLPANIAFQNWLNAVTADLERLLWPTYDVPTQTWSRMPEPKLINADFELLGNLHKHLAARIKGHGTCFEEGSTVPKPCIHRIFFNEEDDEQLGLMYERYDPDLPERWCTALPGLISDGIELKVGSVHYQLKAQFQRPRAYQVAMVQQRNFEYLWAKSGGTPSFVSGHCLQGCLGGCAAFAQMGSSISAASVDVFKQFTVDIGDRRVFGGVHYPSDNLGSWYTALRLVPHVFEASAVQPVFEFLYDAITKKSDVYAAVLAHVKANPGSPYAQAVEAIEHLGQERDLG
jgi:hypothetical protein